jgi:ferredoxin
MFRMRSGKAAPLEEKECLGCESCVALCDEKAITVTDTRVALSNTCLSLLNVLDEMDETDSGAIRPQRRT